MLKLLYVLIGALLLAISPAQAGSVTTAGAGHAAGASACTPPLNSGISGTADFAFGLQKLRNAYAGNAFTLIRSSDSTTLNVGFVACDVDTAAIATFCNATACKMTVWNDESGNAADCTFLSGQRPTLTLSAYNGHPKLTFVSADPDVCTATIGAITAGSFVIVANTDGGTSFPGILDTRDALGDDGLSMNYASSGPSVTADRTVATATHDATKSITTNAIHQVTGTMNATLSRVFVDNVVGTDDTTSLTLVSRTSLNVGGIPVCGGPCHYSGDMEVVIGFAPDISTGDIGTLNANLKTYWGTP